MNKFEKIFIPFLVKDYVLDEMTKDEIIEVIPNFWRVLRNKYLRWKLNSLNTSSNEEAKTK